MEAAGLASSIITFIEFSCKLVNGTVDAYKKSTTGPASDPHISNIIKDLQDVTSNITTNFARLTALSSTVTGQTPAIGQTKPHLQELQALAIKCKELSDELLAILRGLERKPDGNKILRSFQAAWKTLQNDSKIIEIEKKLGTYRIQILLRLSLILADNNTSVELQLDQIQQGNTKLFDKTISQLRSLQDCIKKLDMDVQAQASQHSHSSVIDPDQVFAMKDIREELLRINQSLKTIPQQAPADLQILTKLRFDHVHTRFDAIVDGEYDVFMDLLNNNFAPHLDPNLEQDAQAHARKALNSWLDLGDNVLHISGKAGSGKSTLMKLLSQDERISSKLHSWAGTRKLVTAKFFFWLSGHTLQNSIEGLYRSILLEVLQQCPELTKIVFPKYWGEISTQDRALTHDQTPFRLPELQDAMAKIVEGFPGSHEYRFGFFIDGLDEYAGQSIHHKNLAKQLQSWAHSPDVRICASSRPHQEFHGVFDEYARINLHELTGPDIYRFSQQALEEEENSYLSQDQIKDLALTIKIQASGVFLWARLIADILCEGIRHLDRFASLVAKIEQAPRELMELFLYLFNQINSTDRTRAYQLLLLSVSHMGYDANALMISWIDNLEDAEFPYNVPRVAYTDEEVAQRINYAERQLKLTCRGLLEVENLDKSYRYLDVYFRYRIRLLHRTVKDFLDQPNTKSAIQQQLRERELTSSDYTRLFLAEIKFARTSAEALSDRNTTHTLGHAFKDFTELARLTPRALEELESLLQKFREEPFSIPQGGMGCQNNGIIKWGYTERQNNRGWYVDISYIHLLIRIGASPDFIMSRVISGAYNRSSSDFCLVLCASWALTSDLDLLKRLLDYGLDFKNCVALRYYGKPEKLQYVPGWVAFLVLLANECSLQRNRNARAPYAVLELLLPRRSHSEQNVLFEFQRFYSRHDFNEAWDEAGPEWLPMTLTLEDLILYNRPPNMDVLLCEIRTRKIWGRWADGFAGRALHEATAWAVQAKKSNETSSTSVAVITAEAAFNPKALPLWCLAVRKITVGDETYNILPAPGVRFY